MTWPPNFADVCELHEEYADARDDESLYGQIGLYNTTYYAGALAGYAASMPLILHDEYIFQVPEAVAEDASRRCAEIMARYGSPKIVMPDLGKLAYGDLA